jgi:hypothetical protein
MIACNYEGCYKNEQTNKKHFTLLHQNKKIEKNSWNFLSAWITTCSKVSINDN